MRELMSNPLLNFSKKIKNLHKPYSIEYYKFLTRIKWIWVYFNKWVKFYKLTKIIKKFCKLNTQKVELLVKP